MTTPTIAEVAGKLSDAQREAILHRERYADPNTIAALRRKGLILRSCLSVLGAEVRDYLSQPLQGTGE